MIKKIGICLLFLFSASSFSANFVCGKALPTNHQNFCPSFKTVAVCYCTSSGLPAGVCQNMNSLYNRMVAVFGSLERACQFQKHTTPQDCLDNWNCYLFGGVDSQGRLCSSTQKACE